MYMLVPDEPYLGFIPVSVIFVAATLLGFASHAPGGLGVFDATMMVALWQFDKEDLLAGLLLFRSALLHRSRSSSRLTILGTREALLGRERAALGTSATATAAAVGGTGAGKIGPDLIQTRPGNGDPAAARRIR